MADKLTTEDKLRQVALAHPGVPLRVVRKTNRHPESRGGSWGWYEVHPVGVTIGYWSDGDGTDDMRNIDAAAFLAAYPPKPASGTEQGQRGGAA